MSKNLYGVVYAQQIFKGDVFNKTTYGVFFVKGTVTQANGVINKFSLRVVR